MASFTMKHALLCSSIVQDGGKRRGAGVSCDLVQVEHQQPYQAIIDTESI